MEYKFNLLILTAFMFNLGQNNININIKILQLYNNLILKHIYLFINFVI